MIVVIPASSNGSLYCNAVFVICILETFIYFLELFFICFETVAGESFVFGSI